MNIGIVGLGNVGFETLRVLGLRHPESTFHLIDRRVPAYLQSYLDNSEAPQRTRVHELDATDPDAVRTALSDHCLDALVCTVGVASHTTAATDFDQFQRDFLVNVMANLVPIQGALGNMLAAGRGTIVVLSSTSGVQAPPGLQAYTPAKWALESICNALRAEVGSKGIRVEVINPSTLRNRHSTIFRFTDGLDPTRIAERIANLVPEDGGREGRGGGSNHFLPRRFRLAKILERLAPSVQDWRFGLRHGRARRSAHRANRASTALITGASSGLGWSLAKLYGMRLDTLHVAARRTDRLRTLSEAVERAGGCKVVIHHVDLADRESLDRFLDTVPSVDLLINNAGMYLRSPVVDTSPEDFERCLTVNFLAPARICAELLSRKRPPSTIINILSTTAIAGRRRHSAYAASKAALWAFTRGARRALGTTTQFLEVLPASFTSHESSSTGVGSGTAAPSRRLRSLLTGRRMGRQRRLTSHGVARRIAKAEQDGRERLMVPMEAVAFLALEALAPGLFRKVFP